jgi:predicted TIM-barrel fold metal-dependent hydrolase
MLDESYRNRNMLPVRPDWLSARREAVIEPSRRIVDPHHHLWDMPQCPFLIEDLAADADAGHAIAATVYIEAHTAWRETGPDSLQPVGETEFVLAEVARQEVRTGRPTPLCAGVVGFADLALGDAIDPVLEAHRAAGQGRFRGIRLRAAAHPDAAFAAPAGAPPEGYLLRPEVQAGVARLARHGLSLDVWVFHTQLADVAALAAPCPDVPMVLNHVGGVLGIGPFADRRTEIFAHWRQEIRALAQIDGLHVKLGGFCMPRVGFRFHVAALPPSSEELAAAWRPYVETCIEAFGPSRCMFESNFPVDKGMCGYVPLWNAFKRLAAGATDAEKALLFAETAERFYRLTPTSINRDLCPVM